MVRFAFLAALALAFVTGPLQAAYPDKPIRLVVPWPPGGPSDTMARIIAAKLSENLGQPVLVDNRAGASGVIGSDSVAKSAPDGYTLLWAISNHVTNKLLFKTVPYDPVRDFQPVALVGHSPYLLVVHPSLPVNSVKELVDLAKSQPGKLAYASDGNGTNPHLGTELFKGLAGVDMLHVPYKGTAPAINDLLGGQTKVYLGVMSVLTPHVKSGKLRALAVASQQRVPLVPELPTIAEAGFPGFEIVGYQGILAPANTPPDVVARLNAAVNQVIALPDVRERLVSLFVMLQPQTASADQFRGFIAAQQPKFAKLVKDSGVTPE